MNKVTVAWIILIGTLMFSAGGVLMNWDGISWRMLVAGLLLSMGGNIVAYFSRGINQLTNGNGNTTLPLPEPPTVQPLVRR